VLIRAKREGKIASLQAELDKLRSQGEFWIAEKLYQQALRAVGER
jgi:predicted nucleic acid-binding protein